MHQGRIRCESLDKWVTVKIKHSPSVSTISSGTRTEAGTFTGAGTGIGAATGAVRATGDSTEPLSSKRRLSCSNGENAGFVATVALASGTRAVAGELTVFAVAFAREVPDPPPAGNWLNTSSIGSKRRRWKHSILTGGTDHLVTDVTPAGLYGASDESNARGGQLAKRGQPYIS